MDYTGTSGRRFLAMKNGEDSAAGPLQRTHLAELSAETSAGRSQRVPTLRKISSEVSSTVRERARTSLKVRKHVLEILHKPGLGSLSTLQLFCTVFWLPRNQQPTISTPCAPPQRDAHRHGTWRGASYIIHFLLVRSELPVSWSKSID